MRTPYTTLAPLLALLFACSGPRTAQQSPETQRSPAGRQSLSDSQVATLQALLDELAQPPFGTGAAVTLSAGGRVHTLTAGTEWEGGPAVGPATRFNWASVSKLVTAARVIEYAHEGRLELDDPLRRHLPGVSLLDAAGNDHAEAVTIRHLLAHRAGLPHQPAGIDPGSVGSGWTDPALLSLLAAGWQIPLVGEPGTYGYSNVGYALLAAIVEKYEGASFAPAMQPWLAGKRMEHATFWPGDLTARAAHGRTERDGAVQFLPPGWYGSRYALPFSGLWATTGDLVHFAQALLAARADPAAPLHLATTGSGHGLGPIHRQRLGRPSIEHDGGNPGFLAWLVAIPAHDLVLAVACNGDGESRERGQRLHQLIDRMLEVVVDAPQPASHAAARDSKGPPGRKVAPDQRAPQP